MKMYVQRSVRCKSWFRGQLQWWVPDRRAWSTSLEVFKDTVQGGVREHSAWHPSSSALYCRGVSSKPDCNLQGVVGFTWSTSQTCILSFESSFFVCPVEIDVPVVTCWGGQYHHRLSRGTLIHTAGKKKKCCTSEALFIVSQDHVTSFHG